MNSKDGNKISRSFYIDRKNYSDLIVICQAKKQSKSEVMDSLLADYVKANAKICKAYQKMLKELEN